VGDREQQIFLGREISQRREVSEKTAELVDTEMKRILQEAHDRAREILAGDMQTLHVMAEALLERETLDREEVDLVAQGKELPPRAPAPEEASQTGKPSAAEDKSQAAEKGPVLGTPPAEPAGA
jgi:cell division protease FtsH